MTSRYFGIPAAAAVFVAGVATTGALVWQQLLEKREAARASVEQAVSFRLDSVRRVREANLARLETMKAYFESSNDVRREEFAVMAERKFSHGESHVALAFAPRVRPREAARWEQRIRAETGQRDLSMWENAPQGSRVPASERPEHFPLTYIAPSARARPILGYDMASEPVRRAAIENAIATGKTILSRPPDEPGQPGGSQGFILLKAVYSKGPEPASPDERRQRAAGVVVSRFVYGGIMRQALAESPAVGLYHFVYATAGPDERPLVYRAPREMPAHSIPAPAADLSLAALRALPEARVHEITSGGWAAVYGFLPAADLRLGALVGAKETAGAATGIFVSMLLALGTLLVQRRTREARIEAKRFEGFFRLSPVPAGMADVASGRVTAVNEEWQRQFGYSEHEVVGKRILDLEVSTPEALEQDLEVLAKDGRYDLVSKNLRTRSGDVREHLVTSHVIDIGGRDYILWMSLDVTERNRARRALEASEARLRLLLSATPAVIYTCHTGAPRVATYVSDNVGRVLGYDAQAMTRDPMAWARCVHPEDLDRVIDEIVMIPERGGLAVDYRMRRADGEYRWVHDEARMVAGPAGGSPEVVGCLVDVTEHHLVLERLALAEKMEAIGQLTGGLAHDFNNLLGIIIGNLDLLAMDLPAEGEARKSLDAALATAMRGAELSRRLLALARRETPKSAPVALAEHVASLTPLLERNLGKGITLESSVHFDGEVRVDPGELDSVLINLAINARDAMPQGGRLVIAVDERVVSPPGAASDELGPGRYARIRVSDTGAGMTPEVRRRAMEPFFTTKGRGRGTGMGLAMAFGFARRAGGSLSLYSEPGKGTTVNLMLPVATNEAARAPAAAGPKGRMPRGDERILVVDDEKELAMVAQRWLSALGYAARACSDPREALALIREGEPLDLLLTDVVMPGIDGMQLAREATALRPALGVLLTSGFSHELLEGTNGAATGWRLLDKPYRQADLAVAVRAALDRRTAAAAVNGPVAARS